MRISPGTSSFFRFLDDRALFQPPSRSAPTPSQLYSNPTFVSKLRQTHALEGHNGCCNTVQWNEDGTRMITGSDDLRILIWDCWHWNSCLTDEELKPTPTVINTSHSRNIFCATFVPQSNCQKIISCGADGEIHFHDIERSTDINLHSSLDMVLKCVFLPDSPSVFLSAQADSTIRRFDLREKIRPVPPASASASLFGIRPASSRNVVVDLSSEAGAEKTDAPHVENAAGINTIVFSQLNPFRFAAACVDPWVRLFDIRTWKSMISFAADPVMKSHNRNRNVNTTGIAFNSRDELVCTFSGCDIYLFDASDRNIREHSCGLCTDYLQSYSGHRNVRTFLKEVCFFGPKGEYVCSGSDCANLFIWDKESGEIVQMLKADKHVVNGIAPHPLMPLIATCGIDDTVKIFEPTSDGPTFSKEKAQQQSDSNKSHIETTGMHINRRVLLDILRNLQMSQNQEPQVAQTNSSSEQRPPPPVVVDDRTASSVPSEEPPLNLESVSERFDPHWPGDAISLVETLRQQGNAYFHDRDYQNAFEMYDNALDILENSTPNSNEQQRLVQQAREPCLLNRAACSLQLGHYSETIRDCTEVLQRNPPNVKALFRRGMARMKRGDLDEAQRDLQAAAQMEPNDRPIQNALNELQQARQARRDSERKAFSSLFR